MKVDTGWTVTRAEVTFHVPDRRKDAFTVVECQRKIPSTSNFQWLSMNHQKRADNISDVLDPLSDISVSLPIINMDFLLNFLHISIIFLIALTSLEHSEFADWQMRRWNFSRLMRSFGAVPQVLSSGLPENMSEVFKVMSLQEKSFQ